MVHLSNTVHLNVPLSVPREARVSRREPGPDRTLFVFREFDAEVQLLDAGRRGAEHRGNHRSHALSPSVPDTRHAPLSWCTATNGAVDRHQQPG